MSDETKIKVTYADQDKKNEELPEMIRYDSQFRVLVTEKSGIDPEMTDFLFGRPLMETVRAFGVTF